MTTSTVDTRTGGLGDVLMRLNALYALSALRGGIRVRVVVARPLFELAEALYASRLEVTATERLREDTYTFTHLGLRRLLPEVVSGRRFINPFVRELARQTGRSKWKSALNLASFQLLDRLGRIRLPQPGLVEAYSGWTQVSGLPLASRVPYHDAREQLVRDLGDLRARLRTLISEGVEPRGLTVFPSGTSFQVMPVHVAAELARHAGARFAFHAADPYQDAYRASGLEVVCFNDVRGLLATAAASAHLLATDSFPSHLLQLYSSSTLLALSQSPRSRIVHPGFEGPVIESTAPCCPCINNTRSVKGLCPVGRARCLVWDDPSYLRSLRAAVAASNDSRIGASSTRIDLAPSSHQRCTPPWPLSSLCQR